METPLSVINPEQISKSRRRKVYFSPILLLIIIISSVFIVEAVLMWILSLVSPASKLLIIFTDTLLLTVLIFPILVLFMLRPMNAYLRAQKLAEEELLVAYKTERSARQAAEVLSKASKALTQSMETEKVASILLEYTHQLIPFDAAQVLLHESPEQLVSRAVSIRREGISGCFQKGITHKSSEHPIYQNIFEKKTSVLIDDIEATKSCLLHSCCPKTGALLGVPLITDTQLIGFCCFYKQEPGFFTPEHIRFAEAMVSQTAINIQNTWLFDQVCNSRSRLQTLSRRLVQIQENERKHISRELHDEAGQSLTSIMVRLRLLEESIDEKSTLYHNITGLKKEVDLVSKKLHGLAMDLRPTSLDHLGLIPALESHIKEIGQKNGLNIQFKAVGLEKKRFSQDLEIALYRIAQEGLTNIVKHAKATQVDVLLEARDGTILLLLEDNGLGFDPEKVDPKKHLGLVGIRERAETFHGALTVESSPGAGTTFVVEMPYVHSHIDY